MWSIQTCSTPAVLTFAAPHYSRQHPDARKVGGPGRQLVLTAGEPMHALWLSTWQAEEYTDHRWKGAWVDSLFRRTGGPLASEMIRAAVAATRAVYGEPHPLGMITFIDREKVPPTKTRKGPVWGRCYLLAGFEPDGETEGGLLCLRLAPDRMPLPVPPIGYQERLF